MAWDAIDLRTGNGSPLSDSDRDVILDVAGKAILDTDQDPALVIQAVKRVSRRLGIIQNLRAYATRAIKTALKRSALADDENERGTCQYDVERIPDVARRDQIENRVLVREALEVLSAQDREIILRRMAGETYTAIERDMNLTPHTAPNRVRAAKRLLRQFLDDKIERQTRSSGG